MKLLALLALTAVFPAHALDAACEPYLKAAEKGTHQPARHSIAEYQGGMRLEAIVAGDVLYTNMDGKWRKAKAGFWADERAVNADVRKGTIKLGDCKNLGQETIDGIDTTVISYTITMAGAPPATGKAYIGKDGLVYALSSPQQKVRYRYSGVTAPR